MVETVILDFKRFDYSSTQGFIEAIKHIAFIHKFDLSYSYKKFVDNIKNGTNNLFVELINFK